MVRKPSQERILETMFSAWEHSLPIPHVSPLEGFPLGQQFSHASSNQRPLEGLLKQVARLIPSSLTYSVPCDADAAHPGITRARALHGDPHSLLSSRAPCCPISCLPWAFSLALKSPGKEVGVAGGAGRQRVVVCLLGPRRGEELASPWWPVVHSSLYQ